MKIDFIKAILENTERYLAKPSITGETRRMLLAQRLRLLDKLPKKKPTVKVKSRSKTKKKK